MTKKTGLTWLISSVVAILAVVVAIALFNNRSIPNEFKSIPGFVKATKIKGDNFDAVYDITIKDKTERTCRLTLKIDADGNLIFPEKDETFTVAFIDGQGYKLFDRSGQRGDLPGVFITKIEPDEVWSVAKLGTEHTPVTIEPGKINNLSLENDTFIDGPRGLPVSVVQDGIEIASGRLPLSLKLGRGKAEVKIKDAYASQMQSNGLIHIFHGSQPIYPGKNKIHLVAQAVGSSVWLHKGRLVAFDGTTAIIADGQKLFFKNGDADASINVPGINPDMGAFTADKKIYWVDIKGFINITSFDGTNEKTSITTVSSISKSGEYLVAGTNVYSLAMQPVNPMPGWRWTVDGWFLKLEDGYLVASGKTQWKVKTQLSNDASCLKHSTGKAFFELNNKVSGIIDLQDGTVENGQELVCSGQGDINFPDGVYLKGSVQYWDGKSLWERKDWDLQKFGAFGVLCSNSQIGEKELVNHDNGLKIVFWYDADCSILYLDKEHVVFKISDYVFSVKRFISQY